MLPVIAIALAVSSLQQGATPSDADLVQMLKTIDERTQDSGDYKSVAYLEQKERGKEDVAREVVVYRRDSDDKLAQFQYTAAERAAGSERSTALNQLVTSLEADSRSGCDAGAWLRCNTGS